MGQANTLLESVGQPLPIPKSGLVRDIGDMHAKFGVNPVINTLEPEQLLTFLQFRIDFLQEELDEMIKAKQELVDMQMSEIHPAARDANALKAADDIVDALIDLCVVAIGTLDAFEVDTHKAWNSVHAKNMQKNAGVNANRPNPLGLPDLIKPTGWTPPSHSDNIGLLSKLV